MYNLLTLKLSAQIKLIATKEQTDLLKQTLEQANALCNAISEIAWQQQIFKQFDLHKLLYKNLRDQSGLAAQVVVRCISKVADAYKLDKKTMRVFDPHGAISFDNRILTYRINKKFVTIWTINGRERINYVCGEHQDKLLEFRQGESDLAYHDGEFFLFPTIDIEPSPTEDVKTFIGVDLGIKQIAADSTGESFSGEEVEKVRQKYHNLRRDLQKRGSKNSARRLKKIAKQESRFRKDKNHCIANKLVKKAKDTKQGIGLEDLKHIRARTTVRKADRARHSGWAFSQLQAFILYKALRAGVKTEIVNAGNSSRQCSVEGCGHIAKTNRKSQALFVCGKCGHSENADLNAAKVIAQRALNLYQRPQSIGRSRSASKLLPAPVTGTASSAL